MASIDEVKKLVKKEIKHEIKQLNEKVEQMKAKVTEMKDSMEYFSKKYDELLSQIQSANAKSTAAGAEIKSAKEEVSKLQQNLEKSKQDIEEIAQYLRRDCVEISGVLPSHNHSCEEIVTSLAEEMGINIEESDISTAHPLPTYSRDVPGKIIVKFARRNVRNKFYGNRSKIVGKKVENLNTLRELTEDSDARNKVYISESLTTDRKKLFGSINRLKKNLQWKYIWTNNSRIYLKENENSRQTFTFDRASDLEEFQNKIQHRRLARR